MKKLPRFIQRTRSQATAPKGEARGNPVFDYWSSGRDFLSSAAAPGPNVNPRTALTFSAWFAAINVLSTDLACLPLKVYRARKSGGRDEVTDDPRAALLAVSPDGETTSTRWRQAWVGQTLGHGNGVAEIGFTGGEVSGLYLTEPGTEPQRRSQDKRLYYRLPDGSTLPPYKVLHLAGLGPDGLTGYSVARQARQAIALGLSAETFGASFFANGSRPSGALKHPGTLKGPARQNLRDSWAEMHSGASNSGSTVVLEEGMDWIPFTIPPEDAQFLATRQFQVIEVARLFRLPPHKLGDYSQAHLANLAESNQDYYNTTLMPWCVAIENELTCKLLTADERKAGHYIQHQMNALLRADPKARAEFYTSMFGLAVMTPNSISELEDMNPIGPQGDERFLTVQAKPLSVMLAPPAPPAPPPSGGPGTPPEPGADPVPAADMPAPADGVDSMRSLRFNPNHGKDGKFASGHGAGARGPGPRVFPESPHLHSDLAPHADAARAAAPPGTTAHVASGPPITAKDAAALKVAEGKGGELARITFHPQVEANRDPGLTSYRVGGKQAAVVQANEDGSKWSLTTYGRDHNNKPVASDSPVTYRSRDKAEANAEKHARNTQRQESSTNYLTGKSAADLFDRKVVPLVAGAMRKHDSYTYVLRRDGGRSARYNPYHGKDGKFTGPHGGGKGHGKIVPDKTKKPKADEGGGGGKHPDKPPDAKPPDKAPAVKPAEKPTPTPKPEPTPAPAPAVPPTSPVPEGAKPAKDFAAADAKEVKAFHETMSADWKAKLTPHETNSVEAYTSSLYEAMNHTSRTGKAPAGYDARSLKNLNAGVDSAIGKSGLKHTVKVYRGTTDISHFGVDPKDLVGSTLHEKGYLSTSLNPKVAESFAGKKGGAVFRIHAPAGSRGASVAGLTGKSKEKEREVLFARGAKLKVTAVTRHPKGHYVIDAEVSH